MTVGELLEAMHELCEIEIIIRENGDGRFKYMYVIGDHVQTYSGYGYSWANDVEPGEIKKYIPDEYEQLLNGKDKLWKELEEISK